MATAASLGSHHKNMAAIKEHSLLACFCARFFSFSLQTLFLGFSRNTNCPAPSRTHTSPPPAPRRPRTGASLLKLIGFFTKWDCLLPNSISRGLLSRFLSTDCFCSVSVACCPGAQKPGCPAAGDPRRCTARKQPPAPLRTHTHTHRHTHTHVQQVYAYM